MTIEIPNFSHRHKFWFYVRKAIFQGILPISLAILTFFDFVKQMASVNGHYAAYTHIYFYTSLILFLYAQLKVILEFIFSTCADDIVFKKEVNLTQTTQNLLLSIQIANSSDEHFMIVIRRIFKLRYCNTKFFKYIDRICWLLGLDSPILIPYDIVSKLGNVKEDVNLDNECAYLHTTLTNLYTYHPTKYNAVDTEMTNISRAGKATESDNLLPRVVVTEMDKTINDLKKELFNKEEKLGTPNV